MGCLFVLMASVFPRTVLIVFWLARPDRVDEVFSTVVWPVLGIVFLPFATLMYVLLWQAGEGVTGADWSWVVLAGFFDVLHWGLSAAQNRRVTYGDPV